jgi:hypothetical protein
MKVVGLVGKGLTFDSGGYNLKVNGGIEMMKYDMGGAGAVLGAAQALAALRPPGVQARAHAPLHAWQAPASAWKRHTLLSSAGCFSPSAAVRAAPAARAGARSFELSPPCMRQLPACLQNLARAPRWAPRRRSTRCARRTCRRACAQRADALCMRAAGPACALRQRTFLPAANFSLVGVL